MSELLIQDGTGTNKYLGSIGTGATGDAYHNIPADFYTEVQKGNVVGHSIVQKHGHNTATANGSWQGVLDTTDQFNFLTAASTLRVKAGGNANDSAAGTGAQAITVVGLDNTGAEVTESIELAGASASAVTTASFWRVFRIYITPLRVGAYGGSNVGAIVIENGSGGTDLIGIKAELGQSEYASYSIPLGKTAYILSVTFASESSKASNFRIKTRESLTDTTTPFAPVIQKGTWNGVVGVSHLSFKSPRNILPALTDVWIEAEGAGAISEVSASLEILLVDN